MIAAATDDTENSRNVSVQIDYSGAKDNKLLSKFKVIGVKKIGN